MDSNLDQKLANDENTIQAMSDEAGNVARQIADAMSVVDYRRKQVVTILSHLNNTYDALDDMELDVRAEMARLEDLKNG